MTAPDVASLSRDELEAEVLRLRATRDGPGEAFGRPVRSTPAGRDELFAAIEKTRMPMILTDPNQPDDPIIFANRAFQDLSGYGAEELIGRNCRFLQGPETDPSQVQSIREALAAKRDIALDLLNYRRDGSIFLNELFISPVLGPDGEVLYHFGSQLDVTGYRKDRQALEHSEQRQRAVFESAVSVAIIVTDREGLVTDWNSGAERIFGWSRDDMRGQPADRFFTPEDRAQGRAATEMRLSLEDGRADNERWHLRKDGSRFWASGEMMPLRGDDGTHLGFIKIARDRTADHLAGNALEEAEARLRRAQEAGGVGLFTVDMADNIVKPTPEFCRLYGLPVRDSYPAKAFEELVVPEDAHLVSTAAVRARAEHVGDVEYRIRRPDTGEVRWIARKAEIDRDEEGRAVRFNGAVRDITEQRAAREALQESEDHFRHTVELNPQVPWTADPQGNITSYSTRWLELTGQAPGEPDGAGWAEALHPDDLPHTMELFSASLASGDPVDVNYRIYVARDGAYRWMRARAQARRDAEGEIIRWYGVVEDIHDRRLAEDELQASEEQFRVFAQAAPNHVWAARPDGYLYWLNDKFYGYSGAEPGTLDGATAWSRIVHPDDRAAVVGAWTRSLASGEVYQTEFRMRRADGAYRWFLTRAEPVRGADGAVSRWVGTSTDIEEQKLIQAELARLNATLWSEVEARTLERNRLWATTNDLMGTAGADGYLKTVNPAWTQMLGWSAEELLARPFFEIIDPADHAETTRTVARLARGETVTGFVDRVRTRDGELRTIMWTATPETGADIFYVVGRDLTEQHRAEEQLRQAQKMEAVGQLTGGLAHDFNNLLAGIAGSLDLMSLRLGQGRIKELDKYMVAAQGAAKRAAALTHRLLAFSRRQTLAPKPTDVNKLALGMEDLIRRTVGPAIEVVTVGASSLWPALVDASQLENALLNLCINARDAMPDGGRLTIETANKWIDADAGRLSDMPPGPYLTLCVTDTGVGMSRDLIEKVFEPFFTTKPLGEGTGLGLSMIYGFVQQSGGQVRIYSEVGVGTTVCLYLPRHYGSADEERPDAERSAVAYAEAGETVLVVDDEPTVRMLVTEVLEDLGYTAIEANDSLAGLRVLQSDVRVDLLITDVGLPGGMNGRQMADAGRERRPDLKVLFITGYAENAVLNNGHLAPAMQVLTKPFAVEALAARIRELGVGGASAGLRSDD